MRLRFGLIGCGDIGRLRDQAVSASGSMQLTAVSDLDTVRAQAIASRYGSIVEPDWRRLVRRDDIDAVIVSTPPSLHAGMCIEALRSGKHVLCEKPMARTVEECRSMVDAAEVSRCMLAIGFNYRFYPSISKAREILESGVIGELDHIRSYTGYSAAEHSHDWLHDANVMGGGSLRDNGIHLIDTTCYFLGDVTEVKGFTANHVWNFSGCEDNGFALLKNGQDRIASLHASWTEWLGYRFLIEIYGSRGAIRASCFPMWTQVSWGAERAGKMRRRSWYFPFVHVMEHLRSYRWVVAQSFIRELYEFENLILGRPSKVATGQDGLRSIEIASAAGAGVHPMALGYSG